ncbi:MAG: DedA family protein [Solirubrobacteraceae bacterium]
MLLLLQSSVTDSLVNVATHLIRDIGLTGVGLLTMSSGVIGVPGTEPTMLFAGFNVFQGHLTLLGIIAFGLLGDILGATIAYAIGYFGSRELFERQGSKFHMSAARLDRAHGWFMRYGIVVVVLSRLIPFARAAFPYAAGVARMPYGRFIALATLGSIPWIAGLGILGRAVGSSWQSWRHNLQYADYVGLAIVVCAIAFLIVRLARDGGDRPTPNVAS